jgi:hypothetical protein
VRTSAAVTIGTGRFENDVRDVQEAISLEKPNQTNNARTWARKMLSVMEMIKLIQKDVNHSNAEGRADGTQEVCQGRDSKSYLRQRVGRTLMDGDGRAGTDRRGTQVEGW